jgi:hypothetical protein
VDAWHTVEDMARIGRLTAEQLEAACKLVRSAAVAGIRSPRPTVATELLERITSGQAAYDALAEVEDLIAIQHNRMLIDAGRGGRAQYAIVIALPERRRASLRDVAGVR